MICSKCNAENPDYYVFCQNCFADLTKGNSVNPVNPVAKTSSGKYSQNESSNNGNSASEENYYEEQDIDLSVYENASTYDDDFESEAGNSSPDRRSRQNPNPNDADMVAAVAHGTSPKDMRKRQKKASRDSRELEKLQTNQSAEYYDYYDYYDEAALKREKHRSRKTGAIIAAVILILVIALVAVAIVFANKEYGGLQNAVEAIFVGKQPVLVGVAPDDSGNPAHMLTIRGKEGEVLKFNNPEIAYSVPLENSKSIGYTIPDDSWIPDDPEPGLLEIEVVPDVSIVSKNGTETPLVVQNYIVSVPETILNITEPMELSGNTVSEDKIRISGQIGSGNKNDARLYVNDFEVGNEYMNEDGVFSVDVTAPAGDFEVNMQVKAKKSITSTAVVSGNNPSGSTSSADGTSSTGVLKFDQDLSVAFTEELLNLSGTTTPNSSLSVSAPAGDTQYDPTTGAFSFVARLSQEGSNSFEVKIGEETETLVIKRVPPVNEFTTGAARLDYKYALDNPNEAFKKDIVFDATVIEIIETSPEYVLKMQIDDSSDIVHVTYYGLDKPELNQHFRVFARTNGNVNQSSEDRQVRVNAYYMYRDDDVQRIKELQQQQSTTDSQDNAS